MAEKISVVFITSRFPFPTEKGDKLRAYQQIKQLHQLGHYVSLVSLSDTDVASDHFAEMAKYCSDIQIFRFGKIQILVNILRGFFRLWPFQVSYFYMSSVKKKIKRFLDEKKPEVAYFQLVRTALYAEGLNCNYKVLDYQDAFSVNMRQRKGLGISGMFFTIEAHLLKRFEACCYNWFDNHLIISERDLEEMSLKGKSVHVLQNAVDTDYYKPVQVQQLYDIVFVGNMNYEPNVKAAVFLIENIMPLVWNHFPTANVVLAGSNPHRKVKSLATDRVKVTGWVDDIRSYYASSRVFVAPMTSGTGLQNKLLEAMSMARPCVTTDLSAIPIGPDAKKFLLTGNTVQELSEAVISLLKNKSFAEELGRASRNFVVSNFGFEAAGLQLEKYLKRIPD